LIDCLTVLLLIKRIYTQDGLQTPLTFKGTKGTSRRRQTT